MLLMLCDSLKQIRQHYWFVCLFFFFLLCADVEMLKRLTTYTSLVIFQALSSFTHAKSIFQLKIPWVLHSICSMFIGLGMYKRTLSFS